MGFMKNYLVWLEENGHVYWNDLFETYDWNTDPMTNPDLLNKYMTTPPYDPDHDGPDYIDLFDADGITADAQAMLHEEDTNGDFV